MKNKPKIIFAVLLAVLMAVLPAAAENLAVTAAPGGVNLSITAPHAILIDTSTGTVLYEKDADTPVPIASVTKIMTLLLCVEAIDAGTVKLTDKVCVSERAASMGGSQMYLEPGEEISIHELLKAVTVASANDGAVALAEHISGSLEAFVDAMNKKAAALGMEGTVFYNPTGLDDKETNLSSARGVSVMSRELLSHELIFDYTKIWTDSVRNGAFGLANTNKLIRFYSGATGLKTGSTDKAKYCLSASAKRDTLSLDAVVLGAPTSAERFSDAKAMLDYGFANYSYYIPNGSANGEIRVWGGKEKTVKASAKLEGMLLSKSDAAKVSSRMEMQEEIFAPVEKGQCVGKVIFEKDGETLCEIPILTESAVAKMSFSDIFAKLISLFFFGTDS